MKRTTLFALLLCLGLVAVATRTVMRRAERGMQRLDFSHFKTTRVDHIQITGDSPVELLKDGSTWRLANGRQADANAVAALLRTVTTLHSSDHVNQDEAALAAAGLTGERSSRVRLLKQTQVLADFILGATDAQGTWVRENDRSFRVANLTSGIFRHPAQVWLQRRLFNTAADDVQRLEVALKGQKSYTLQREEAGWRLTDPTFVAAGFRFDSALAARLVTNLTNAHAENILDEDPGLGITHLDAPLATLTLFYNEAAAAQRGVASQSLQLGAAKQDGLVYATVAGRPEIYVLPAYLAQSLQLAPTDLRDMTLMRPFELEQVNSFTLTDGGQSMTVQRQGTDGWRLAGRPARGGAATAPMLLDQGKVLGRLRQVMGVHGAALAQVPANKAGLTARQGQFAVHFADGSSAVMQFGKPSHPASGEPDGYYVRGTADAQVYVLQKGIRNNLLAMGDSMKSSATQPGLSALSGDALKNLPPEVRRAVQAQMQQQP